MIPSWLWVIFIAALPIIELRGALPVAALIYHMPWYEAIGLSILGNMLPVPFILWGMPLAEKILRKISIFDRFFNWLFARTRRKAQDTIRIYGLIGLAIFVAIPLPATGAWTGSLVAYLFGFKKPQALLSIFAGVIAAGAIVASICYLFKGLLWILGA
jgi:uncharacterized membrane protein